MKIFAFDARTATPHFPGIGRHVRSLPESLKDQLEPGSVWCFNRRRVCRVLEHPLHQNGR